MGKGTFPPLGHFAFLFMLLRLLDTMKGPNFFLTFFIFWGDDDPFLLVKAKIAP